jgi:hypothetical protein
MQDRALQEIKFQIGTTLLSGRPRLVCKLSAEQKRAFADYFFLKEDVKSLRDLAKVIGVSVQGASNISFRVLAQWAEEGRVIINPSFKTE